MKKRFSRFDRNSRWTRADSYATIAAALVAIAVGIHFIPTSLVLQPEDAVVEGRMVTSVRHVPWGPVNAWVTDEVVVNNGSECYTPRAYIYYQEAPGGVVDYEMPHQLWPCIDQGLPYTWRSTWQAVLFGFIKLAPIERTIVVGSNGNM